MGTANVGPTAKPTEVGAAAAAGAAAELAAVAPKKNGRARGGKKQLPEHQRHRGLVSNGRALSL